MALIINFHYCDQTDRGILVVKWMCTFYTVNKLEVRFSKGLKMIVKQNNFYITCLYLQEYKKGFAFLTKFHYFEFRGGLNWAFNNFKKFQKKFSLFFTLKYLFRSFQWILNDKIFFKKKLIFFDAKGPPFGSKNFFCKFWIFFQIFFFKSLLWMNISIF